MTIKKRWKLAVALALALIAVISSFALLDFGIYQSESSTNQQMEKFSAMEPEVDLQEVYLYVERGDMVSDALEKELKEELQQNRKVFSFGNLKEDFDGPVVAVELLKEDILYTPFYSQADLDVLFFFSASGNTTYFQKFVQAEFGGRMFP